MQVNTTCWARVQGVLTPLVSGEVEFGVAVAGNYLHPPLQSDDIGLDFPWHLQGRPTYT
jgi:hypothetical protein